MTTIPFSGGYLDFVMHPDFGINVPKGPPRASMLEDLCFYWLEYGNTLHIQDSPNIASVFLKKLTASNYMQLIEFVRSNLANLEYQLSLVDSVNGIEIPWVEQQWADLHGWSRQCLGYVEDVEAIMLALGISSSNPDLSEIPADWTSSEKDFRYIHKFLKDLKIRTDVLISSITGLAGIAGNRQALREARRSFREAKAIKTLTLLGMIFIPLAFCTGLFSMSEQYLPGAASSWVYFAVSIPLVVLIFILAFAIDLGYDDEGVWTLGKFMKALTNARSLGREARAS